MNDAVIPLGNHHDLIPALLQELAPPALRLQASATWRGGSRLSIMSVHMSVISSYTENLSTTLRLVALSASWRAIACSHRWLEPSSPLSHTGQQSLPTC
jgi:hypothetical protein